MTGAWRAIHLDEPKLAFGHDQTADHPKDGLFLFGPVGSNQNPARMDVGVIATPAGLQKYSQWVASIEQFIDVPAPNPKRKRNDANTFVWPGFEAVYGAVWPSRPFATCLIDAGEVSRRILGADRHQAIFSAVALYEEALRKYLREEDARPTLWFAVVSDEVFKYGRPKSSVPVKLRTVGTRQLGMKAARSILTKGSMFAEEMEAAAMYEYELNFHNQLKARLMDTNQVIQVVKEITLDPPPLAEMRGPRCRIRPPSHGIFRRRASTRPGENRGASPNCATASATSVSSSSASTGQAGVTTRAAARRCSLDPETA
jgi:hypothetical protein